jgi:hypothetical protein
MAAVVCVHGIGQQRKGTAMLHDEWAAPLVDGVKFAGGMLARDDVRCVAYGDLFRPAGQTLGVGDPYLTAEDADEFEQELLLAWWRAASAVDPGVISPEAETLIRTPRTVQAALRALSGARFFTGLADRAMLFDLRQVRRYVTEPAVREAVQARVSAAVEPDTRVLVGHSLGSVVSYEALCRCPEWPVTVLVTLGSPLGIRGLVFDRLTSTPPGAWPGGVKHWVNVADSGDVVALEKDLRPLFGPEVVCHIVDNGTTAHDVRP